MLFGSVIFPDYHESKSQKGVPTDDVSSLQNRRNDHPDEHTCRFLELLPSWRWMDNSFKWLLH